MDRSYGCNVNANITQHGSSKHEKSKRNKDKCNKQRGKKRSLRGQQMSKLRHLPKRRKTEKTKDLDEEKIKLANQQANTSIDHRHVELSLIRELIDSLRVTVQQKKVGDYYARVYSVHSFKSFLEKLELKDSVRHWTIQSLINLIETCCDESEKFREQIYECKLLETFIDNLVDLLVTELNDEEANNCISLLNSLAYSKDESEQNHSRKIGDYMAQKNYCKIIFEHAKKMKSRRQEEDNVWIYEVYNLIGNYCNKSSEFKIKMVHLGIVDLLLENLYLYSENNAADEVVDYLSQDFELLDCLSNVNEKAGDGQAKEIGDYLSTKNCTTLFVKYAKEINDTAYCQETLRSLLWNYSCSSETFAKQLANEGIVELVMKDLYKYKDMFINNWQSKREITTSNFGILAVLSMKAFENNIGDELASPTYIKLLVDYTRLLNAKKTLCQNTISMIVNLRILMCNYSWNSDAFADQLVKEGIVEILMEDLVNNKYTFINDEDQNHVVELTLGLLNALSYSDDEDENEKNSEIRAKTIGDYLANEQHTKLLVEYAKILNSLAFKENSSSSQSLHSLMWNYSVESDAFASQLSEEGIVEILMECLVKYKDTFINDEDQNHVVESTLGLLDALSYNDDEDESEKNTVKHPKAIGDYLAKSKHAKLLTEYAKILNARELEKHDSSSDSLRSLLWNFSCESDTFANQLVAEGIVEILMEDLVKYKASISRKDESRTIEPVLGLLSYLSYISEIDNPTDENHKDGVKNLEIRAKTIGDYLANEQHTKLLVEYAKILNSLAYKENSSNIKSLHSLMWNYSVESDAFASQLSEEGIVEILMEYLVKYKDTFINDEDQNHVVESTLGLLYALSYNDDEDENEKNTVNYPKAIGDYLAKSEHVKLFTEYAKILNARELEKHDSSSDSLCSLLWNFSYESDTFANQLVKEGIVEILMEDLVKYKDSFVIRKKKMEIIESDLGNLESISCSPKDEMIKDTLESYLNILHNCSKQLVNFKHYDNPNTLETLLHYSKDGRLEIKIPSLLSLSHIVDESNTGSTTRAKVIEDLLELLKSSLKNDPRKTGDFPPFEFLEGLPKLALIEENSDAMIRNGILSIAEDVFEQEKEKEMKYILELISALSYNRNISNMIKSNSVIVDHLLKISSKDTSAKLAKYATGALTLLDVKETKNKQVLISYHPEYMNLVARIKTELQKVECTVAVNTGNRKKLNFEGMKLAVKGADVVLMCISRLYKHDMYCRKEATYAVESRKNVVPVIVEEGFKPNGWLDDITSNKHVHNFTVEEEFETTMKNVIEELSIKLKPKK